MKKIIGKLLCRVRGHKRGKRVGEATDIINGMRNLYCQRCGARWWRKARA